MSNELIENYPPRRNLVDATLIQQGSLPGTGATVSGSVEIGDLPSNRMENVAVQFRIKTGTNPGAGTLALTVGHGPSGDPDETVILDAEEVAAAGASGTLIELPFPDVGENTHLGFSITATGGDFSGLKYEFGIAV